MFIEKLNKIFKAEETSVHLTPQNTVVVCGAGISFNSGLPSGYKIVSELFKTINANSFNSKVDLHSLFQEYNEKVVSKLLNTKTSLYHSPRLEALFNALKTTLTEKEYYHATKYYLYKECVDKKVFSSSIHFELAEFISRGGDVLTANFDRLIEDALIELECESKVVVFPLEKSYENSYGGALVKYHGDIETPKSIGIDLSNLSFEGFKLHETSLLNKIFEGKENVLFVGFSVSDTLDLVPYLRKYIGLNYFYLNYQQRVGESQIIDWRTNVSQSKLLEPFDFFCKENNLNGFHIFESYDKEIVFTEKTSTVGKIIFDAKDTSSSMIINKLKDVDSVDQIYLAILKNFGLLNLLDKNDLRRIEKFEDYNSFYNNINGNYFIELTRLRTLVKQARSEHFKYFIKLQEFVFLQKGKLPQRLFYLLKLPYSFVRVLNVAKKRGVNQLANLYAVNLFWIRIFQILESFNFLKRLVPSKVLLLYQNRIKEQLELCKSENNLRLYRFTYKEYWYFKCFWKNRLNITEEELFTDLQNLIKLNADSNYLLDINNLLRQAVRYLDINKQEILDIAEDSCRIINDELNLGKLREMRMLE